LVFSRDTEEFLLVGLAGREFGGCGIFGDVELSVEGVEADYVWGEWEEERGWRGRC